MTLQTAMTMHSPADAGFAMPPEWAPHTRCWMAWPDRVDLWGTRLDATQHAYAEVARAIRRFEPVTMVANPASIEVARQHCDPNIDLLALAIDDAWARDMGPSFLKHPDGSIAGTAWRFNAWGGKSPQYGEDAQFAGRVLRETDSSVYHSSLCLEGGGIHVDGEGTVLTTESVVLNPNRNSGINKVEAEKELCRALGARKVIWLPGDPDKIEADVTDGHVDGTACFVRPGVVLFGSDPRAQGPLADLEKENRLALERARDAAGRSLEILLLDHAWEAQTSEELFCRSYVNFYIANGGIVMPSYGIPGDKQAHEILSRAFPKREIVQVDIRDIAPGGGGIHCITQQQPA